MSSIIFQRRHLPLPFLENEAKIDILVSVQESSKKVCTSTCDLLYKCEFHLPWLKLRSHYIAHLGFSAKEDYVMQLGMAFMAVSYLCQEALNPLSCRHEK